MSRIASIIKKSVMTVMLGLINGYRWLLSPLLGSNCRHLPTCSQYAKDALIMHGPLHGSYYAVKRILRCHPWAEPAVDPVLPVAHREMSCDKTSADKDKG